jgi:ATP-dependent exoDNAse (exonuclease V) beta subunit
MGHVEPGSGDSAEEVKAPRAGSLLQLLWHAVAGDYMRAFDAEQHRVAQQDESPWILPQLRRFAQTWQIPACSGLAEIEASAEPTETTSEVEFYWVGNDARIAGTLVHRWLQLAADSHAEIHPDSMADIGLTTQRWLQRMGIRDDSALAIGDRVLAALASMAEDDRGRWLIDGPGKTELALTGVYEGEVVSVVLDRVRIDEHGVHWVVDYKTSTHEGGKLDSFLDAEVLRYTPQLKKYAALYRAYANEDVRCALYFPLLQQFVKVPV